MDTRTSSPRTSRLGHLAAASAMLASLRGTASFAIGTAADFKIYQEQFYGGMFESITQNVNIFNAASGGAITLVAKDIKGDFERESFLKSLANIVTRRDTTSIAGVTDKSAVHGEYVGVKIDRKIGPLADTLDKWRKIGSNAQEFSFKLGQMIGEAKVQDYCNTALLAVETALQGQAALVHTVAGPITNTEMVNAMAKRGDKAGELSLAVMHSKIFFDLVKHNITEKVFGVANVSIYEGSAPTLGKPVLVLDAPCLTDAGAPATYNTLFLVPGAVEVAESEKEEIVSQMVTGLENLVMRIQGEYAFNVKVKGFKYNESAGINPNDAAVGTAANWIKEATDNKSLAGVRLVTQ